jgi:cell wall-associated NlpC family hydrolase
LTAQPPTSAIPPRAALVIAGAVAVALAAATWIGVAAVGAIDSAADRTPAEMIRAVPASYRPAAQPVAAIRTVPARMGDWTAQRGVLIAERALRWRNWPYSFGAGGADGPSYGVPVDADSRNDDKVFGFDCSGLTMYAVAPWRAHLDHDAASQYTEVGSFHPAIDSLLPGDLVFWSKDGTIDGIGHVAIYVGNGLVVQAPQSGDVIRVTPIYQVEPGTMGATRPLT